MRKYLLIATSLLPFAFPASAQTFYRIPFDVPVGGHAPNAIEADLSYLKTLVAIAQKNGNNTVFVDNIMSRPNDSRKLDVIEVDLIEIQALIEIAEKHGDKTAFIGGPIVWARNGETAKPGVYLLFGGGITTVSNSP
jgi:hypothetical protein